ncbi:MAG TPA: tetratricopeptide repeat protein [Candidatus Rifleibacterium sp.]|nr:tetratricopeptide repeat protein [Candidatus Rifleibacterium sp.]HPT44959.1 tetratricopeptide repeat protein [Candidatus Rifleibacterium sp.]
MQESTGCLGRQVKSAAKTAGTSACRTIESGSSFLSKLQPVIGVAFVMFLMLPLVLATGCCNRQSPIEEAGKAYQSGDFARAAALFAPAAEKGDPEAQANIAFMYYCGMHVEKSHKLAAEWYRRAADRNHPTAQFSLGTMYENGEGLSRSLEEAYFWYSLAEKQGDKDAQRLRRELELKLSKAQVTSQKKRVSDWKPGN